MSVAVITPFFNKPTAWVQQCLDSVSRQTVPCTHFLVCDGDKPSGVRLAANVQVLRLPRPHEDFGNAARAIGSVSAISQGFDAIAYLDADNWYEPEHVQCLWEVNKQTQAAVSTSGRNLFDLEGNLLGPCPEVDGEIFVDTNCLFLTRAAFGLVSVWYLMPKPQREVGDRVFWRAVKEARLKRAHLPRPTLAYRTAFEAHYQRFGKEPPPNAKPSFALTSEAAASTPAGQVPPRRIHVPASTKQQTISLCMIVRDEETNLAACLESVKGLVDEIIVVDTGSTDCTKEIAKEYGAKVKDFAWVDDFSAARNEALKHATCDWVFWFDADDRLDEANREKFQRLKAQLPDGNFAYTMKQWSPGQDAQGTPMGVDHVRLFRRQDGVAWRYRLHEQILPSLNEAKARLVVTDILVDHLGYQDPGLRQRKLERNIRILLKEQGGRPDDAFVLFNLAGTFLDMGEVEKAVPYLHGCIEKAPRGASFLPKAYTLLAQAHRQANRWEEALKTAQQASAMFPNNAELWFEEGLAQQACKNPHGAKEAFERLLQLPRRADFVGTDEGVYGHLTRHHLALALRELKQFAAAEQQLRMAIAQAPHFPSAWLGLGELLLEQKRDTDLEALIRQASEMPNRIVNEAVLSARRHLARKSVQEAQEVLEQAIEATSGDLWLRMFLADVLLRHGVALDRAQHHLRQVLVTAPQHGLAKQMLRMLEVQMNG